MGRRTGSARRAWLVSVFVGAIGCSSREPDRFDWVIAHNDAGTFSPEVGAADPAVSQQRLWGFYPREGPDWSWTADRFAVAFGPIRPVLKLRFSFSPTPERKQVTIAASVNGRALSPETYSTGGDLVYSRELDVQDIGRPLKVELSVAPTWNAPGDKRTLGIVVHSVAVEAR
jgi:hypothetical protein